MRLCLGGLFCLAWALPASAQPRPELRAFWADGFNAGFKTPEQVDLLLQRLHKAHCNAVFAQMRKGGDAYYLSRYEPWARDDPTHFDALAYLIEKAHAMNPPIAVHAWINTCAVGGNSSNPFNIVHLHPDWLSLDPRGKDFDGEATKIDPGHPEAADWTFRIYLDVVRHYPVDGIHFDFVRYGGKTWGYNPVSVDRFQRRQTGNGEIRKLGNQEIRELPNFQISKFPSPDDETWKQWRRDQVTGLVRKVYAHAMQINPKVVVSAATIAWADAPKNDTEWRTKSAAMNRVFQDWRGWLEEGMIDLACPMTYFQADYHAEWQRHWSVWIKALRHRRAVTIAVGNWFNTISQSLAMIADARKPDPHGRVPYGIMLYSYAGTNASAEKDAKGRRKELTFQEAFYAALGGEPATSNAQYPTPNTQHPTPFPTDVPPPHMPWKTATREGILKGFVRTAALDPVDGAVVTLHGQGKTRTLRTDGTGFYAFVALPTGDYRVQVAVPGTSPQEQRIKVTAGQVTTAGFSVGRSPIALYPSLASLQHWTITSPADIGIPVRLDGLRVTLGTDTFPGTLYVLDGQDVGMRVRLASQPLVPFQPGDVISVSGILRESEREPVLHQAIARLTDILPDSALPAPRAVKGEALAAGTIPNGIPVQVKGRVTSAEATGFTLEVDGARVRVLLAGRKEPGVEATTFGVTVPPEGADVAVTGILGSARTGSGQAWNPRLHPRFASDVHILALPTFWQSRLARVLRWGAFAVLLIALWLRNRARFRRSRN